MKNVILKTYAKAILLVLPAVFAALIMFICSPQTVKAQSGTLGDEVPYVYFTYQRADDETLIDGNNLQAGTYNVSIHLTDLTSISVFEVTASYDTQLSSVASSPASLISETRSDMESMGYLLSDGNIVFGFVSTNADCSALPDDAVIASFEMTFTQACNANDIIDVSINPNLTFAQVDYNDGYDDEYSLTKNDEKDSTYVGTLSIMTCDVAPASEGYNVTGSLVIATTSAGATKDCAVNGTYNITVYDESGAEVANKDFVMSSDSNTFTLTLAPGTYTATISSEYAMTRDDITIIVTNSDITYGSIPIIACDFKTDRTININDVTQVYQQAVGNKDSRFDLNGDGNVNVADAVIVYACSVQTSMDPITIQ